MLLPTPRPARSRRALSALLIAGLGVVAAPAVAVLGPLAAPASASSTYLCTGYAGCAAAGYGNAGYAEHNRTMYWQMYPGHNCTNYVAYRMVQAGMPNARPWSGDGNATNWGPSMRSITDQNPTVGSVAWFTRGLAGGSSGHVAYVEKVISPTQIVVSEDSWSGDFHWATMTKDGGTWPSGFIHFADTKQLTPSVKPTITSPVAGTAQVGLPLTAARGAWKPTGATFTYQWLADGAAISGATAGTFTPNAAQVGKAIAVTVTAHKTGYANAAVTSPSTSDVVPGELADGTAPVLSGEPLLGQSLTVAPGTFSPAADASAYRWQANGRVIAGASGPTLALTDALVGKTISVTQVGRKDGYAKATAASNPVGPVVAGVIKTPTPFRASGTARYGSTLAIGGGTVSPSDATPTYVWYRDGAVVAGASSSTYRLGAADVGHRIVGTVTFAKPHYTSVTRTYAFGDAVTTPSSVRVTAQRQHLAAGVSVLVTAPGVSGATGPVSLAFGDHVVKGQLVDGRFHARITGLKPGWRRVVVTYGGTSVVDPGHGAAKVKVKH